MLEPIVAFFDKLIENFSWRRLSFVLVLLLLAVVSLWIYESYTSSFKLARIERQIALLEKLANVSELPATRNNPQLRQANTNLQRQLTTTTLGADAEYELFPWAKKVLSSATAWLLFALLFLLLPGSTVGGAAKPLLGMAVVAIPFIILSAAIPTFDAVWLNYVAYPIGNIVFVVVLILVWQRKKKKAAATPA